MQEPLITSAEVPVQKRKILLVEDEKVFAGAVRKHLERAGYEVGLAGTLAAARAALKAGAPDLILLDMRLPDGSGLELLAEIGGAEASAPALVMSAYGELEDAVSAMKSGAADYLKKPIDLNELLLNVEKVLAKDKLARKLAYSAQRERHSAENVAFLGECPAIQALKAQAGRIARLSAAESAIPPTVLILGETGAGKDVAARLLHEHSRRAPRPFVHVDCASLPKDLIESELFGHEKGAFTNAHAARTGLIEAAEDGVLFLDEIGEIPLDLQSKLLAVLERRALRRVGATRERPVAAWIIAATNRDIEALSERGEFRPDLYYRLNVMSLSIPALRERGGDILLLARHFATQTARRYNLPFAGLPDAVAAALLDYDWPGNVRELKHLIERAVLLGDGAPLDAALLGLEKRGQAGPDEARISDQATLGEAELSLIKQALQRTDRNVSRAARELGITRMALRYRMKKYDL